MSTSMHGYGSKSLLDRSVLELLRGPGVLIAGLGLPGLAFAGPTGGDVVEGQAQISNPDTDTTQIDQASDRAIINWQTFNVGGTEYVIFNQPSSSSVVLNRVVGGSPSAIFGTIEANGHVFLVNPQGIFFGQGATVDVQGLVASTLDVADADFMAGHYAFSRNPDSPETASVVNEGLIQAGDGGFVVLAGDYAENSGVIAARTGFVVLGASSAMTLDIDGDGLISYAVDASTVSSMAGVANIGSILADGSVVLMTADVAESLITTVVNQSGLIEAYAVEEQDGVVYLGAEGGGVGMSGTILADHGTITMKASGTTEVTGALSANGGSIEISGDDGIHVRADISAADGHVLFDPSSLEIGVAYGGVLTGTIEGLLNAGADVDLVASNTIFANSSAQVAGINAGGSGDLFMGIGHLSYAGSPSSSSSFFVPDAGGTIELGSMAIAIGGDFEASAQGGLVHLGPLTVGGDVDIRGAQVLVGDLQETEFYGGGVFPSSSSPSGSFSSRSSSFNAQGNPINAGGDVNIQANAPGSSSEAIVLTGAIDAGGNVSLSAYSGPYGDATVAVVDQAHGEGSGSSAYYYASGRSSNHYSSFESTFGAALTAGGSVNINVQGGYGGQVIAGSITALGTASGGTATALPPSGNGDVSIYVSAREQAVIQIGDNFRSEDNNQFFSGSPSFSNNNNFSNDRSFNGADVSAAGDVSMHAEVLTSYGEGEAAIFTGALSAGQNVNLSASGQGLGGCCSGSADATIMIAEAYSDHNGGGGSSGPSFGGFGSNESIGVTGASVFAGGNVNINASADGAAMIVTGGVTAAGTASSGSSGVTSSGGDVQISTFGGSEASIYVVGSISSFEQHAEGSFLGEGYQSMYGGAYAGGATISAAGDIDVFAFAEGGSFGSPTGPSDFGAEAVVGVGSLNAGQDAALVAVAFGPGGTAAVNVVATYDQDGGDVFYGGFGASSGEFETTRHFDGASVTVGGNVFIAASGSDAQIRVGHIVAGVGSSSSSGALPGAGSSSGFVQLSAYGGIAAGIHVASHMQTSDHGSFEWSSSSGNVSAGGYFESFNGASIDADGFVDLTAIAEGGGIPLAGPGGTIAEGAAIVTGAITAEGAYAFAGASGDAQIVITDSFLAQGGFGPASSSIPVGSSVTFSSSDSTQFVGAAVDVREDVQFTANGEGATIAVGSLNAGSDAYLNAQGSFSGGHGQVLIADSYSEASSDTWSSVFPSGQGFEQVSAAGADVTVGDTLTVYASGGEARILVGDVAAGLGTSGGSAVGWSSGVVSLTANGGSEAGIYVVDGVFNRNDYSYDSTGFLETGSFNMQGATISADGYVDISAMAEGGSFSLSASDGPRAEVLAGDVFAEGVFVDAAAGGEARIIFADSRAGSGFSSSSSGASSSSRGSSFTGAQVVATEDIQINAFGNGFAFIGAGTLSASSHVDVTAGPNQFDIVIDRIHAGAGGSLNFGSNPYLIDTIFTGGGNLVINAGTVTVGPTGGFGSFGSLGNASSGSAYDGDVRINAYTEWFGDANIDGNLYIYGGLVMRGGNGGGSGATSSSLVNGVLQINVSSDFVVSSSSDITLGGGSGALELTVGGNVFLNAGTFDVMIGGGQALISGSGTADAHVSVSAAGSFHAYGGNVLIGGGFASADTAGSSGAAVAIATTEVTAGGFMGLGASSVVAIGGGTARAWAQGSGSGSGLADADASVSVSAGAGMNVSGPDVIFVAGQTPSSSSPLAFPSSANAVGAFAEGFNGFSATASANDSVTVDVSGGDLNIVASFAGFGAGLGGSGFGTPMRAHAFAGGSNAFADASVQADLDIDVASGDFHVDASSIGMSAGAYAGAGDYTVASGSGAVANSQILAGVGVHAGGNLYLHASGDVFLAAGDHAGFSADIYADGSGATATLDIQTGLSLSADGSMSLSAGSGSGQVEYQLGASAAANMTIDAGYGGAAMANVDVSGLLSAGGGLSIAANVLGLYVGENAGQRGSIYADDGAVASLDLTVSGEMGAAAITLAADQSLDHSVGYYAGAYFGGGPYGGGVYAYGGGSALLNLVVSDDVHADSGNFTITATAGSMDVSRSVGYDAGAYNYVYASDDGVAGFTVDVSSGITAAGNVSITAGSNSTGNISSVLGYEAGWSFDVAAYNGGSADFSVAVRDHITAGGDVAVNLGGNYNRSVGTYAGSYGYLNASSGVVSSSLDPRDETATYTVDVATGIAAGGALSVDAGGSLYIAVGYDIGYSGNAFASDASGLATATIQTTVTDSITAVTDLSLVASDVSIGIDSYLGSSAWAYGSGAGDVASNTVTAGLTISAGGDLLISASSGSVDIYTGSSVASSAGAQAYGDGASATVSISADIAITAGGDLNIYASEDVNIYIDSYFASYAAAYAGAADATAAMDVVGSMTLTAGGDISVEAGGTIDIYVDSSFGYSAGAVASGTDAVAITHVTGDLLFDAVGAINLDANYVNIYLDSYLGSQAYAFASADGVTATVDVDATLGLTAGTDINITAVGGTSSSYGTASFYIDSDQGYSAAADINGSYSSAEARVHVGGLISFDAGGDLSITAGDNINILIDSYFGYSAYAYAGSAASSSLALPSFGAANGQVHVDIEGLLSFAADGNITLTAGNDLNVYIDSDAGSEAKVEAFGTGNDVSIDMAANIMFDAGGSLFSIDVGGSASFYIDEYFGYGIGASSSGSGNLGSVTLDGGISLNAANDFSLTVGSDLSFYIYSSAATNDFAYAGGVDGQLDVSVNGFNRINAGGDVTIDVGTYMYQYIGYYAGYDADIYASGDGATATYTAGLENSITAGGNLSLTVGSYLEHYVGSDLGSVGTASASGSGATATVDVTAVNSLIAGGDLTIDVGSYASFYVDSYAGYDALASAGGDGATATYTVTGTDNIIAGGDLSIAVGGYLAAHVGYENGQSAGAYGSGASATATMNISTNLNFTAGGSLSLSVDSYGSIYVDSYLGYAASVYAGGDGATASMDVDAAVNFTAADNVSMTFGGYLEHYIDDDTGSYGYAGAAGSSASAHLGVSAVNAITAGGDLSIDVGGSYASFSVGSYVGYAGVAVASGYGGNAAIRVDVHEALTAGGDLSLSVAGDLDVFIDSDVGSYAAAYGSAAGASATNEVSAAMDFTAAGAMLIEAGGYGGFYIEDYLGYEAYAWADASSAEADVSATAEVNLAAADGITMSFGGDLDMYVGSDVGSYASAYASSGAVNADVSVTVAGNVNVDAGTNLLINVGTSDSSADFDLHVDSYTGYNGKVSLYGSGATGAVDVQAGVSLSADRAVTIDVADSFNMRVDSYAGYSGQAVASNDSATATIDNAVVVGIHAGGNLSVTAGGDFNVETSDSNGAYAYAGANGSNASANYSADVQLRLSAGGNVALTAVGDMSFSLSSSLGYDGSASAYGSGATANYDVTAGISVVAGGNLTMDAGSYFYGGHYGNAGSYAYARADGSGATAAVSISGVNLFQAGDNLTVNAGFDASIYIGDDLGSSASAYGYGGGAATVDVSNWNEFKAGGALRFDVGGDFWTSVGSVGGGYASAASGASADYSVDAGNLFTTTRGDITIIAASNASFSIDGSADSGSTGGSGAVTTSATSGIMVDAGARLIVNLSGSGQIYAAVASSSNQAIDLSGAAVSMIAGTGIYLTDAGLSVGGASVPGGDVLATSFDAGPMNAFFSGSSVQLGDLAMTAGGYIRVNADAVSFSSSANVTGGAFVQFAPNAGAISSGSSYLDQATYDGFFGAFGGGITALFGSNNRVGDVGFGSLDASGDHVILATAGGDITGSGSFTAASASLLGGGDVQISGMTIAMDDTFEIVAGSDILLSDIDLVSGIVTLVAGGDILNGGAIGSITAEAMAALAGGDIILDDTVLNIGNGSIDGVTGDTALVRVLGLVDVAPTHTAPSATFIAGGEVQLGDMIMLGDYLFIEADLIGFNGDITLPAGSLVQFTPFNAGNTIGFDLNLDESIGDSNYSFNDYFADLGYITIAIGSSGQLGNVYIGQSTTGSPEPIDIGDDNFICATQGSCIGIETIRSTGLVGTLRGLSLVGFDTPQEEEVDPYDDNSTEAAIRDNELESDDEDDEEEDEGTEGEEQGGQGSSRGTTLINQVSDDGDGAGVCGG